MEENAMILQPRSLLQPSSNLSWLEAEATGGAGYSQPPTIQPSFLKKIYIEKYIDSKSHIYPFYIKKFFHIDGWRLKNSMKAAPDMGLDSNQGMVGGPSTSRPNNGSAPTPSLAKPPSLDALQQRAIRAGIGQLIEETTMNKTISSRELAEMVGKSHEDLLRDIREMFMALGEAIKETDEVQLNESHCLTLLSGYAVKYRARVVDRWLSLEARTPAQYAAQLRALADEVDRKRLHTHDLFRAM